MIFERIIPVPPQPRHGSFPNALHSWHGFEPVPAQASHRTVAPVSGGRRPPGLQSSHARTLSLWQSGQLRAFALAAHEAHGNRPEPAQSPHAPSSWPLLAHEMHGAIPSVHVGHLMLALPSQTLHPSLSPVSHVTMPFLSQ
jgi:hypothetical protein